MRNRFFLFLLPLFIFLIFGIGEVVAQPSTSDSTKHNEQDPSTLTIQKGHVKAFGGLWVQTPQGRFAPMGSYASELLRKIHRKRHYRGASPEEWLLGLWADPTTALHTPYIYIGKERVGFLLGVNDAYAPLSRFFDAHGEYLLGAEIERIQEMPVERRNKTEKELLKVDERVNILYQLIEGRLTPIFPVAKSPQWQSGGDPKTGISLEDSLRIAQTFSSYRHALHTGNWEESNRLVRQISDQQNRYGDSAQLDPQRLNAELLYNRSDPFRTAFRGYLLLGAWLATLLLLPNRNITVLKKMTRIVTTLIFALFLWHGLGMVLRSYISGHAPWSNAYETMIYTGWCTVMAGLLFWQRAPLVTAFGTMMGGVLLLVAHLNWLDPQITPLVPVLQSPWLMIHVSVITASYGFFGISTLTALGVLLKIARGDRSTCTLRAIGEMTMWLGLGLLTVGIFFGAIWAGESWGRYWGWDPKETWALITLLIYAFATHARWIPGFRDDYAFSLLSLLGAGSVAMTFFGVNYLLSGLHSYGGGGEISVRLILILTVCLVGLSIVAGLRLRKGQRKKERF